ncbi:hypothetical protein CEXT_319211 [Caerostris extrusa]|uniref:Uncharacterized protein n=1 Tax=Caerostris extrusa TaxID=172846 RepID=A0AAV4QE51_CAEEX|nr:hypothetical protein CEXT_319211 [Caerostris extrusa]
MDDPLKEKERYQTLSKENVPRDREYGEEFSEKKKKQRNTATQLFQPILSQHFSVVALNWNGLNTRHQREKSLTVLEKKK